RGHFAGVVSAHAVRHYAKPQDFVDAKIIFIRRSNTSFVGYAKRTQHATPLIVGIGFPWNAKQMCFTQSFTLCQRRGGFGTVRAAAAVRDRSAAGRNPATCAMCPLSMQSGRCDRASRARNA